MEGRKYRPEPAGELSQTSQQEHGVGRSFSGSVRGGMIQPGRASSPLTLFETLLQLHKQQYEDGPDSDRDRELHHHCVPHWASPG